VTAPQKIPIVTEVVPPLDPQRVWPVYPDTREYDANPRWPSEPCVWHAYDTHPDGSLTPRTEMTR